MADKTKRKQDLIGLFANLDLPISIYKNATERYANIAEYINKVGIEAEIYPQGSFATGTVVRPYYNNQENDFDLDFICCLPIEKSSSDPKQVKQSIGKVLSESGIYGPKLLPEDSKCWILKYSELGGIGFTMDIVPAVHEDAYHITQVATLSCDPQLINDSISITDKNQHQYRWQTSNPRGYLKWFKQINEPFIQYNRSSRRQMIFEQNRTYYSSIDEIPADIERSSLQRVIQILKRHRDVYFSKRNIEDYKPISAILSTITAQIAKKCSGDMDVLELLNEVISEIKIYSNYLSLDSYSFNLTFREKNIITRANNKWDLPNPANPLDNLVDSWNQESKKAKHFFEWINCLCSDFDTIFDADDAKFVEILENGFGSSFVNRNINVKEYRDKNPQTINYSARPWST